jgi:hypothetical protein
MVERVEMNISRVVGKLLIAIVPIYPLLSNSHSSNLVILVCSTTQKEQQLRISPLSTMDALFRIGSVVSLLITSLSEHSYSQPFVRLSLFVWLLT